jgi:hypothetical protein
VRRESKASRDPGDATGVQPPLRLVHGSALKQPGEERDCLEAMEAHGVEEEDVAALARNPALDDRHPDAGAERDKHGKTGVADADDEE